MSNQATQSAAVQVYGKITRQIGGLTPGGATLIAFANVPGRRASSSYYNSRVRQTKQNGAGPTADPINAPWSFTDYAFGTKSLATAKRTAATPKNRWQTLRGK